MPSQSLITIYPMTRNQFINLVAAITCALLVNTVLQRVGGATLKIIKESVSPTPKARLYE